MVTMTMRDVEGGQGRWGQTNSSPLTLVCGSVRMYLSAVHDFSSICLSMPLKQAISLSYTLLADTFTHAFIKM